MNEKAETIGAIFDMLQKLDMRELKLVWRIVYRMTRTKEEQHEGRDHQTVGQSRGAGT